MGWFKNDTDSDKASATENRNNASYKEGYDAGRGGDIITDIVHMTIGSVNSENPDHKGYEQGMKDR